MNQKGQAYLEFLVGFPAAIAMGGLVLFYSLMPLARQYLHTQTYEYCVCLKTYQSNSCKKELDRKLKSLLLTPYNLNDGFKHITVEVPKWRLQVRMKKEAY